MGNTSERVLVGSIQKFSIEDGPGIRTTVFMKGCPLNCQWCHNPELIRPEQQLITTSNNCIGCGHCIDICPRGAITLSVDDGIEIDRLKCDTCMKCAEECYAKALRPVAKLMSVEEILHVVEQDRGFYDNTGGGMTLSGGEILAHADFTAKLINEANRMNINVCLDTSGFGDAMLLMNLATADNVTDILYDMKSIDDEMHKEYTGVSNRIIIDNLKMLAADKTTLDKVTMRMPLIRGVNDGKEIIKMTGEFYRDIGIKRVNLLPYHDLGVGKKKNIGGKQKKFQEPTEDRLKAIASYFEDEMHLRVEILGRV